MPAAHAIPSTGPTGLAWEFHGTVESGEREALPASVGGAFGRHDSVSLLPLLWSWDGAELWGLFAPDVIRTRRRSPENVER